MKILFVEDDLTSRLLLGATLKKLGHQTVPAADGRQAWDEFQKVHFPVVISDWQMPEMDGLELCRKIRERPSEHYTNFILLTAHGGKANYLEAMEAGADDFVTKPYDEDQLAARLVVAERQLRLQHRMSALESMLSVCAFCKKIRDEDDCWEPMEAYISEHTETQFSHAYCPQCMKVHFPDL
jgi:phosphoserine phosphatase RsbU/P